MWARVMRHSFVGDSDRFVKFENPVSFTFNKLRENLVSL